MTEREEPDIPSRRAGVDARAGEQEERLRKWDQLDQSPRVASFDRPGDRRAQRTSIVEDERSASQQLLPPLMLYAAASMGLPMPCWPVLAAWKQVALNALSAMPAEIRPQIPPTSQNGIIQSLR